MWLLDTKLLHVHVYRWPYSNPSPLRWGWSVEKFTEANDLPKTVDTHNLLETKDGSKAVVGQIIDHTTLRRAYDSEADGLPTYADALQWGIYHALAYLLTGKTGHEQDSAIKRKLAKL